MKILTFNWHEGYIHLLSKTGYQFDVVQKLKGGIFGWIHEFRPVPSNCNLITEDDARSRLNAGYYDRIICHNINDLIFVYESTIHKVLIFHNKLSCEIALGGNTINKEEYLRQVRGLLEAAKNRTLVFISKAKRDDWGLDGEIILPGIDISEYGGYTGHMQKVLRVGNGLKFRDIMLGYSFQEKILNSIQSTILGLNPDIPDSYIPKSWDELKDFMRAHRVFLNTTSEPYEDGYNLAMLEAMATGMPVVSIANPTSPIEDSVNGFVSDDEDYLRERIIELLKDYSLAKSIGQKARETVIEKFPIERFISEWKRVLGDLTGFQCYSVDLKCRICGSPAKLFYKSDRKFYRCPNCLLIFTEHILGKKDCERHYKAQWETVDEGFWRNQADAVLNIVHQYIIPHRILDFGAGSGGLTKELIRRGLDVVSFEPMLHGDFKAQNFANKFDVVVAMEVIEHIESIYQVLEDIEKVLSKDGVIFFSTCLTDKFIYQSNAVEQFQHWWYKDDLTHVNYFCRNAVTKLAQVLKYNVDFYGDNVFVLSRSGERQRANNIKERKRLKVLMSYTSNPATTAVYLEKALRKNHDVITYGPTISEETLKAWNLEAIKDRVKDHDIPYFTPDLKVVLKALSDGWPDGWTPDVFLWIESGIWYQIENIRNLPCPAACYLIDTHIHSDKHIEIAKDFDCVFIAQKEYIQMFKDAGIENVFWLPLACDPEIHTPLYLPLLRGELKGGKKLYDIGFVGSLIDHKRIKLLNKLKERFNVYYERCFLERMAEVFSQSKIVFNNSINNDLNMRVFEAMASGSMLITDEAKGSGLTELFQDKRHLVIYRDEKELIDLADCYLRNDTERERIAEHGMREVLGKHTYEHRVEEMVNVLLSLLEKPDRYSMAETFYKNGVRLWKDGKRKEALEFYKMAFDKKPEDVSLLLTLVNAASELGQVDVAKDSLADYLEYHPLDIDVLLIYADICFSLRLYDETLSALEKVGLFAPDREKLIELKNKLDKQIFEAPKETSLIRQIIKLHVGCGSVYKEGYINIDAFDKSVADVIAPAHDLPYPENSIDLIESHHLIEHLSFWEFRDTMKEWYRVLKYGGKIIAETPDLIENMKIFLDSDYTKRWLWYRPEHLQGRAAVFFGHQRQEGQLHKCGFDRERIAGLLTELGFTNIHCYSVDGTPEINENFLVEAYKPILDSEGFSLILPTYCAADELDLCLTSLNKNSRLNHELVILIDRNRDTGLFNSDIINILNKHRLSFNISYFINDRNLGPYGSWNRGAQMASRKILAFITDDQYFAPDWDINIKKHVSPEKMLTCQLVEPGIIGVWKDNLEFNCGASAEDFDEGRFLQFYREKSIEGIVEGGFFIPLIIYRDTFLQIGGFTFDDSFGKVNDKGEHLAYPYDLVFNMAAKKIGVKLYKVKNSFSYHFQGSSWMKEGKTADSKGK